MKLRLFHKIGVGGEDSAEVRKFLIDNGLSDLIEFSNIEYENPAAAVKELIGSVEAPVLATENKVLRGKSAIIDWLKTNILVLRD